jgi:hypothetical protein
MRAGCKSVWCDSTQPCSAAEQHWEASFSPLSLFFTVSARSFDTSDVTLSALATFSRRHALMMSRATEHGNLWESSECVRGAVHARRVDAWRTRLSWTEGRTSSVKSPTSGIFADVQYYSILRKFTGRVAALRIMAHCAVHPERSALVPLTVSGSPRSTAASSTRAAPQQTASRAHCRRPRGVPADPGGARVEPGATPSRRCRAPSVHG